MLGMFSKATNIERLDNLNARIKKLEAKPDLTDFEVDELGDAREAAQEINQWLLDMWRAEGGGASE